MLGFFGAQLLSQAAITISGAGGGGSTSGQLFNAPVGGLVLVLVDTTGNGFLGPNSTWSGTLTTTHDPGLGSAGNSLDVNGLFGGDLVISRFAISGAGQVPLNGVSGYNQAPTAGKNFAAIWFPELTSAHTGEVPANAKYGILHGPDWVIPSADGNYTTSATLSSWSATTTAGLSVFARMTNSDPGTPNGTLANTSGGTYTGGFGTTSPAFTIVPEPSVALLGLFGGLAFLRRRR